jgi:hypothetical protein
MGELRELFRSEPPKSDVVLKIQVYNEFCLRHTESKRQDTGVQEVMGRVGEEGVGDNEKE